ncbi:MAG TPA: FGGY family carbohydrate kinase, partial [Nitrospiraceae bacterium]
MSSARAILAIDQGTTSSRAMLFDRRGQPLATAQQEFPQHFPQPGWVEHEPEDIWRDTLRVAREALAGAGLTAPDIATIGITNQRETTVLWDRKTGEAVHKAIVWQDRRTAPLCDRLRRDGYEPMVKDKTGLLIDSYFSATKIVWLLENVPGARARAERGDLAFGTIDSFLLWRLTGGRVHATDATNAARTLLYDIKRQAWD